MSIRTLHIINGLGTGGAERSLAELLPDLRAADIDPHVAIFHEREEGVEHEVRQQGHAIHHITGSGWAARVRAVRRLIAQLRPGLIHTTIFEADVVGRLAALGSGVPVLTSLVNTSYDPVRLADPNVSRAKLRAVQAVDGFTARHATSHFHAITAAVADAAVRDLSIDRSHVTVIPRGRRRARLGDQSDERRRSTRSRLGIGLDAEVVVHVGRQEHQKAHDVLLAAMRPVLAERPAAHLVLAGRRGNASGAVDKGLASLPGERVRVLGHVDDVPDLLAAADVFAFPSRYEGQGGAAVEALGLGRAIVASDIPALREMLDGAALLVPPESPERLAAAITTLLDDPERRHRLGAAARVRFDERYEHEAVAAAMIELFREHAQ